VFLGYYSTSCNYAGKWVCFESIKVIFNAKNVSPPVQSSDCRLPATILSIYLTLLQSHLTDVVIPVDIHGSSPPYSWGSGFSLYCYENKVETSPLEEVIQKGSQIVSPDESLAGGDCPSSGRSAVLEISAA